MSDLTFLKIMALFLFLLALVVQSWITEASTYNNWSTCNWINWKSVCTYSTCEVTTQEIKKTVPLDVSAIIAKLTQSEQLALSQYYQAQVGCNTYPMQTITEYVNNTVCNSVTDSYCGDYIIDDGEQCDDGNARCQQCKIVKPEADPIPTYAPVYNYSIVVPTWASDDCSEMMKRRGIC